MRRLDLTDRARHTYHMQGGQKGFSATEAFGILFIMALLGFAGWHVYNSHNSKMPVAQQSTASASFHKRLVAVGDIACDPQDTNVSGLNKNTCQDKAVAELAAAQHPDAVLLLGDIQYSDGAPDKFKSAFAKNWDVFKPIAYPAPGNHEYGTPNAAGYFGYFADSPIDVSKGYYRITYSGWLIVSLNSNCTKIGGCGTDSEQMKWLAGTLEKSGAQCALALWHHPRFTSGEYAGSTDIKDKTTTFWGALIADHADIVLNGHDHIYERFAPQTTDGKPSDTGLRQFTVGTGGRSHYTHKVIAANSEKIVDDQFGVLVLDLYKNKYKWQFKTVDSQVLDSGEATCN